jgi:hypothetical protein
VGAVLFVWFFATLAARFAPPVVSAYPAQARTAAAAQR